MTEIIVQLLTLIEVADLLRLSPHTVRSLVRKENLRPTSITRKLLFIRDDIKRFIAAGE